MIGFKNASGPIFEKIQKDAAGKKRSREWYRSSLIKYLNEIPEDNENPDDGSRENNVQVGEMYFFPNYLMHCVFPFKNSNEERRSISFNATVDEEIYNVYGS